MSTGSVQRIGEVMPVDAWTTLKSENDARLIDVRTQAEWDFVGVPDLSEIGQTLICVQWASFPGMSANTRFVEMVMDELGAGASGKFLFLCRSGVRSMHAAQAIASHLSAKGLAGECINVAEGFEGNMDYDGHRGNRNGWKNRGLAWRQS